jgi:predicted PolB exonuclease-like 3'-5' exonuclease
MPINADAARLFKSEHPRTVIVLDAEVRYDDEVHRRYQATERWQPEDVAALDRRHAQSDPRVTPRWACQQIVALSWLVMTECEDGLRPVRMRTVGKPEHAEAAIVQAFFADVAPFADVQLVSWNGFGSDLPRLLLAAATAGLRLPNCLVPLHAPWPRNSSAHLDLMTEMCGGAERVHLAEVAAKLGIPTKLSCRADLVSKLMEQGKWALVKAHVEGDVLTTGMVLMRWRHLVGGTASVLEATRRMTRFVAEHCRHRDYAADWARYGEQVLHDAMTSQTTKLEALAA